MHLGQHGGPGFHQIEGGFPIPHGGIQIRDPLEEHALKFGIIGEFLQRPGAAVEGPLQGFRIAPAVDFLGGTVQ